MLVPIGRFCVSFWRRRDFNAFCATAEVRQIMYLLTNVPLKLESTRQQGNEKNDCPIHYAFVHVLALLRTLTRVTTFIVVERLFAPLGRLGVTLSRRGDR